MKPSRCALRLFFCLFTWSCFTLASHGASGSGFALSFNGTGTVTVTNHPLFNSLPLSITFWMQATQSLPAASGLITKSAVPTALNGWEVFVTNGQVRAAYFVSPFRFVGGPDGLHGPFIANGSWHHVAFVVDTNGGRLFVDGALAAPGPWTGVPGPTLNTNDMHLGSFVISSNSLPFRGTMDEITVWNVALSPGQIFLNMSNSLAGNEPGLIGYYRCDESAGPTLFDAAPAAGTNNGTIDSSVTFVPSPIGSNAPSGPTVQTIGANTSATDALLIGSVNPMGDNTTRAWFEWGTTTNYGNVTGFFIPDPAGNFDVQYYIGINNLTGGTLYHFRAVASNSVGMAFGNDLTLLTPIFGLTTNLTGICLGAVAWGDYNNDGRLDLLTTGATNADGSFPHFATFLYPDAMQLWRNTTNGFVSESALPATYFNYVGRWSDFNNDDRLDIALVTLTSDSFASPDVLVNTGTGFSNLVVSLDPGYKAWWGSGDWGDYDNDGRLDLLRQGYGEFKGENQFGPFLKWLPIQRQLIHNTRDGLVQINLLLPPLQCGSAVWGDYDNDGRPDILITGVTSNQVPVTQIWRNTGSGFSNINVTLPGIAYGSAAWGDYDNDGLLDVLLVGATNILPAQVGGASGVYTNYYGPFHNGDEVIVVPGHPAGLVAQVWRNTGNGFSNINAGLPGVWTGNAVWGDYDNDGRLDILLTGATNILALQTRDPLFANTTNIQAFPTGFVAQIWRNTGSGFSNTLSFPGVHYSSSAWGDYDGDGRLDLVIAGATSSLIVTQQNSFGYSNTLVIPTNFVTQIWRNFSRSNSPPTAPTGLSATTSGGNVTFRWNASTDANTPSSGLTYNLRVGSIPGGADLVAPMSASNGARRLPQFGNAGAGLSRTISGLPMSSRIYWSVQAVDNGFAGSSFAPEQSFTFNSVFTPSNGIPVAGDIDGDGVVSETEFAAVLMKLNGNGIVSEFELSMVLSNYWPYSPWLRMTNVAGLGGMNVTFSISNSLASAFTVEYSTNLTQTNWYPLGPALPRYLFTDTNAPAQPQRYYRLRWP